MIKDSVKATIERHESLKSSKAAWNKLHQDVVDYVLPNRQSFTGVATPGRETSLKQFDSTATWALDQLAAGFHSYLTSPTERWLRLTLPQEIPDEVRENEDIARWLDDSSTKIYTVLNNQKSNFNPQMHELYLDVGGFGTAIIYVEERDGSYPVRFCTYHLSKCTIGENADGIVNELYREYDLKAVEAVARFGKDCPEEIRKFAEKTPTKVCNFLHAVFERYEYNPSIPTSTNMKYASLTIWLEKKELVKESGYRTFPYMVPRWSKLTGEIYGRSPAMIAMPDIRMINAMAKTVLKAGQKAVDPPLELPNEGYLQPINQHAGGITYFDASMNPELRARPLQSGTRPDIGEDMIEKRRQVILRAFYNNLMQANERGNQEKTATQVMQEREERMQLMSPAVARLQSELLDPLVERVFEILLRKGWFTKPPEILNGITLQVEYVSPIARAQRMSQVTGVQRMLETLGQIGQAKPEMWDRVDGDGLVDFFAAAYDTSHKILTPEETVRKIREDRQKAQDAAMKAQEENMGANTAQQGAQAMKNAKEAGLV